MPRNRDAAPKWHASLIAAAYGSVMQSFSADIEILWKVIAFK